MHIKPEQYPFLVSCPARFDEHEEQVRCNSCRRELRSFRVRGDVSRIDMERVRRVLL